MSSFIVILILIILALIAFVQTARLSFRDAQFAISMRHITPEIHQALLHAAEDAECQFNLCRDIESASELSDELEAYKELHLKTASLYRDLLWRYSVYPDPKTAVSDWELCTNPKHAKKVGTGLDDDSAKETLKHAQRARSDNLCSCGKTLSKTDGGLSCDCGRRYIFGKSQFGDGCLVEVTTREELAQGNIEHAE